MEDLARPAAQNELVGRALDDAFRFLEHTAIPANGVRMGNLRRNVDFADGALELGRRRFESLSKKVHHLFGRRGDETLGTTRYRARGARLHESAQCAVN